MTRRGLALILGAVVALVVLPASAAARVPHGFVGVVADGPLLDSPQVNLAHETDTMRRSGIESVRVVVAWRDTQPYATWNQVPPEQRGSFRDEGGVPTNYAVMDRIVGLAAERRLRVLPVVLIAPPWAARHPGQFASPPSDEAPYARFVAALARRYGPRGSYWSEHPRVRRAPVRAWQIWNEPSLRDFWSDTPWAKDYVALLRATRSRLRAVDPHARIILAGLPNESWTDLARIYKAGGRRYFDAVAFHPFTRKVSGVFTILKNGRKEMRRYGDARKPALVTELSWPSAQGRTSKSYGIETSERGQADKLRESLPLLARRRKALRIQAVYWYTWLTEDRRDDYPFDYAGASRLENGKVVRKPAFRALRDVALDLNGTR